ncbi:hypothetical protein GQ55_2G172700 [Panicum hallii var. hallii]|uniref:Uncharacterized protein n=1 Tax=Panicum hallii var. hallii TaxID=1504633 RepID=A0A2T7EQ68_9POAL|nr:hypothetical protein GQ55_2G172700 [Panicum hallii var. hallii]
MSAGAKEVLPGGGRATRRRRIRVPRDARAGRNGETSNGAGVVGRSSATAGSPQGTEAARRSSSRETVGRRAIEREKG